MRRKSLKKANKEARVALEETTKEVIEGLTNDQCDDLLAAKWIEPLQAEASGPSRNRCERLHREGSCA